MTRIDMELEAAGFNFVRYVDDYEVFLYDDSEQSTISEFSKKLKIYGFSLNYEKTEVVDFPYYIMENFNKILGEKLNKTMDTQDIIDIFNSFLEMEKNGTKGAVRFLVKVLQQKGVEVEMSNKELYKAYLISVMANNERSLTKACSIFIDNQEAYPLSANDVESINRLLDKHIIYEHDLEVIWLIYLLVKTRNLDAGSPLIGRVVNTQNELAQLILLHNGLLHSDQQVVIKEKAKSWILLYELFARDSLSEEEFAGRLNLHHNLDMYKKFKSKDIHFIQ